MCDSTGLCFTIALGKVLTLNDVNNEGDSSDSDNDEYASDDDAEQSFESDDEGNFRQNPNKTPAVDSDEEADDDEEDGEEEIDSDDIEDIDDEDEELEGEDDDEEGDDDGEGDDAEDALNYNSDSSEELEFESGGEEEVEANGAAKAKKTPTPAKPSTSTSAKGGNNKTAAKAASGPNAAEQLKNELNKAEPKHKQTADGANDEYEKHDTDDEEDIRNTVGNIPMRWYDEYKHIGYDWDAKKIIKPEKGDQLDDFLKRMEDPNFWRTVKDPQTGQEVILSEADIDLIRRINSQKIPDAGFDEYAVGSCGLWLAGLMDESTTNNQQKKFLLNDSRGSTGSHPKRRKCPFEMCPITSVRSFRRCPKRRKCPSWCTPSKWAGSRPTTKCKRPGRKRARNSICCGRPIPAERTCVAFTITCRRQSVICPATPNRTTRRPSTCSTTRSCANGTNSATSHPSGSCTLCRKSMRRCVRCPRIRVSYASDSCGVWTCICVRVLVALS